MRIGLSYDLKEMVPMEQSSPDDALEEYDSAGTVELIARAFESRGHSVVRMGGGREFLDNILNSQVDIVFNIAEGRGNYRSRESQVPSILEMLDIPYSGSDPQCLAICLDKALTKKLVAAAGIRVPNWCVISDDGELWGTSCQGFSFPAIIKPLYEGSSKGIRLSSLVNSPEEVAEVVGRLLDCYHQPVMVEEFIVGEEVTVGIVGNSPPRLVGVMRIIPADKMAHFVYSLEVKRDWRRLVEYECPAQLEKDALEKLTTSSLEIFRILGCRDFARLDFRVSPEGIPYFIEINPLPGLGDYSDLVIMAQKMGWSYEELINTVLDAAIRRYPRLARTAAKAASKING